MAALINVFLEDSTIEHTASPFDKNTSAGVVLKELQKAEVGTLKKATGVTVTEESGILPADAYRFYRAQSDGKCSFDELVRAPLPAVEYSGSSKSVNDKDGDRCTHPTRVLRYENYNEDVKGRLQQADVQEWRSTRYDKMGFLSADYQLSEDGAVACLQSTAGWRVNHVFDSQAVKHKYTIHPSKRRFDTQEEQRTGLSAVELQPEEEVHRDVPDLCLVPTTGPIRKVVQATKCKHRFRLLNVNSYHLADIFDGYTGTPRVVPGGLNPNAAYNAVHAISQVMLYSALCNLEDQSDPYPTALAPGQRPISVDESRERRKAAAEQLSAQRAAEQQEVSSSGQVAGGRYTRSGQSYSRAAPLPAGALHLTCRLGSQVFLGSLFGRAAAVRLAIGAAAQQAAQLEAEAYERLQPLQAMVVPRLLAHGYTLGGDAYFVATEFIEGNPWDWHSAAHRALDDEVLSALDEIHKLGVLHGDLHEGNILVTPECKVVVLDFNGAHLEAPANELTAEQDHVALLLAMQVAVH
ncbi:hypothetical protein WJX75_009469 [Coccomyxa subellipsoidea]|uniref:Aminoglycoside phosphotransferase domain-containing protein n=1 Tax=Coccomyxa subellipsoidea TaxID=248742 RepID=A0ABR2YZ43_9CHLO